MLLWSSCIFMAFGRVTVLFSLTLSVGNQPWAIQRAALPQACDHLWVFSLCYLVYEGLVFTLKYPIIVLVCFYIWVVISSFVNLSIEKLPWYLPLPHNIWNIPGLMDECVGFKTSKMVHIFIRYFFPSFPWMYMCFLLRDLASQTHNCFKYITEYHFKTKHSQSSPWVLV